MKVALIPEQFYDIHFYYSWQYSDIVYSDMIQLEDMSLIYIGITLLIQRLYYIQSSHVVLWKNKERTS